MRAFTSVFEEQEHGSADLDSCPDCSDAMVTRGGEKVCAGCGTRQPMIITQARHDWAFVARMVTAVNRHWEKKSMGDMSGANETPGQPVTPEQIDQVFSSALGFPAREADKQIVAELGGTTDVLAEYLWDHWMGEPEEPNMAQVQHEIEYILEYRDTNYLGEQPHLEGQ